MFYVCSSHPCDVPRRASSSAGEFAPRGYQMKWNEPYLIRYPFRHGERAGEARLGFPHADEKHPDEWVCSFQLYGLPDSRIRAARGNDGLQALVIASDAVRKSLDRLTSVSSDLEPYEIIFPRYLPFCLGLDFHRRLCKLVDAEVEKEQETLAARRSSRKP